MEIHIINNQNDFPIDPQAIKSIVSAVAEFESYEFDEVSIHLVDTEKICYLHKQFFNDPSQTDCISFPIDDQVIAGYRVLGEVFVCPKTALEYSQSHDTTPSYEITLYIIHGLLHLMGYDDIEKEDIQLMRSKENLHLDNLKKLNLML